MLFDVELDIYNNGAFGGTIQILIKVMKNFSINLHDFGVENLSTLNNELVGNGIRTQFILSRASIIICIRSH